MKESALTHGQAFNVPLTKKNQLLYMHLELAPLEQGYKLVIQNTPKGQAAMIAPTHGLTPAGPRVQQGGNNDYWKYNEQGYSVRVHKRDRKAMFTPDHGKQSTCAAPLDRFDNYRRTIIHRETQATPCTGGPIQNIDKRTKEQRTYRRPLARRNMVQDTS